MYLFCSSIILGFSLSLLPGAVLAENLTCACNSYFQVGDIVVAKGDNPNLAENLPAGSVGTVLCGISGYYDKVLVEWRDWTDGHSGLVGSCDCGSPAEEGSSRWTVKCDEIEVFPDCTMLHDLDYVDGTLSMDFDIGTMQPATWQTVLIMHWGIFPLWSMELPAIDPPLSVPISFPFPSVGPIGLFSVLTTPHTGIECWNFEMVDTGN